MSTFDEIAKDLPTDAAKRLNELKHGLFTSDLSVNEFLLIKEAGFDPVGLVVGSSIYHIGYQAASWSQNQEMQVLSQAMYHARELAMTRMREEADALGADGIAGVRLTVQNMRWGENLSEFVAIGTAIRARNGGNWKAPGNKPFTSDLSGQDFWTLLKAGYRPLGLVMGSCVYHVAHQSFMKAWKTVGQNMEMENFTQALYEARELAMERMQQEASKLSAEGIVAADIHEGNHSWAPHVIEFFAIGTAVAPISQEHHIAAPQLVLSVDR